MTWELALSIVALVVSLAALILAWGVWRRQESLTSVRKSEHVDAEPQKPVEVVRGTGPAVVVYNPTKPADFDYLKETLSQVARDASLPDPVWLETTPEDTGAGQTRQALEMDASVVIAAGGDGTVREVAEVLAGTNTPLGLLPVGTGNLLARNLDLPLNSEREMAIIALTGRDRPIDVGWMVVPEQPEISDSELRAAVEDEPDVDLDNVALAAPGKRAFIVIAGIGFDADIMSGTDSDLKDRFGWLAYLRAAIPRLLAPKMRARIVPGSANESIDTEARSVMFVNCGVLTGGIVLDPAARPDDGWLELAVLDTRGGLIGWLDVVRRVGLNGLGIRAKDLGTRAGGLDYHRVREVDVQTDSYQRIQADGDVFGYAKNISARIDHSALKVRVRN